MRKVIRPSIPAHTPRSNFVITSEEGAYSSNLARTKLAAKTRRGGIVRLVVKKRAGAKYRAERRTVDLIAKGRSFSSLGETDTPVDGVPAGRVAPPTRVSESLAARMRLYKFRSPKTADFRGLALVTLKQVRTDIDSRAVDYLATVIRHLSTGKIFVASTVPLPQPVEQTSAVTNDPLAAARARGRKYALEQYEHPDNLGLLDARDYAGRNERSINELRQGGELYALLPPGKTRGFRYPKWQFDAVPDRLKAVLRPFVEAKANCWVIHSFMTRKRESLGGQSPAERILDDTQDIKSVIALAESDLTGEQGAQ